MTVNRQTPIVNNPGYLRSSREFPEDPGALAFQVSKSYIETATAVNSRTIGTFPSNRPSPTGESWFIFDNQRQESLRQIYQFTSTSSIPHGIDFTRIYAFSKPQGSFTDGTNYYGLIYGSNIAITGQISFYLTPTNIVFVTGGASTPTLTNGIIILEWISEP